MEIGIVFYRWQISYSLLPTPYSLLPIPYSLFPIPYSLFPIPYSLFPISMYNAFRSAALIIAIVLLSGCNPQLESDGKIILNGNVDDREVNAAFLVSERIAARCAVRD